MPQSYQEKSDMSFKEMVESENAADCFICDEKFDNKDCIPLSIGCTPYSKTRLPTKIGQLMGDDIMVVIARDDMLCKRCMSLINHLDKLEKDMAAVQRALRGYLNKKYKLLADEDEETFHGGGALTSDVPTAPEKQIVPKLDPLREDYKKNLQHKCTSCEFETSYRGVLKSHQAKCRFRQLQYRCSMCDKKFPSAKHVRQHVMASHLSNWPCHYCGANFSEQTEYTTHMKSHRSDIAAHSPEPPSELSDKSNVDVFDATSKEMFMENIVNHTPKVFTCSKCNTNFENEDNYNFHLSSHKVEDVNSLMCSFCSSTFPTKDTLTKHLESHKSQENFESMQEAENYAMKLSLDSLNDTLSQVASDNCTQNMIVRDHLSIEYHYCSTCSAAFDNETLFIEHNKSHNDQHLLPEEKRIDYGCMDDKIEIGCDYTDIKNHLEEMFKSIHSDKTTESNSGDNVTKNNCSYDNAVSTEETTYPYSENCDNSGQEAFFLLPNTDFINEQHIADTKILQLNSNADALEKQDIATVDRTESTMEDTNSSEHQSSNIFEMVRMKKLRSIKLDTNEMPLLLGTLNKFQITCSVSNSPAEVQETIANKENGLKTPKSELNETYSCATCPVETSSNTELKNHTLTHAHSELCRPTCTICDRELSSKQNLENHMKNHVKYPGKVTCQFCLNDFPNKLELQHHMNEIHPREKQTYNCAFCLKTLPTKKSLKIHQESHMERLSELKFKCAMCSQTFQREKQLKDHVSLIHRDPHCRFCGKEILKAKTLKFHELRHVRNKGTYDCDTCTRKFKTRTGLTHHKATHTGDYKYFCSFCNHGFMSRMMMEEHKSKHTKEERYVCDICGKKFNFQSTYWIHRKWHDSPYPYKCKYCERMFRHSSLLAVHKRKHTGERPYKCIYCPMAFTVSGTLKRHMILHTGKYPFNCDECKRGFTTKHKYATHMAKTHGKHDLLQTQGQPCQFKMVIPGPSDNILEPQIELVDWEPDDDDTEQQFTLQLNHGGSNIGGDCGEIILQGGQELVPCTIIGDSILVDDIGPRVVEIVMDDNSQAASVVALGDDASMLPDLWPYQ